MTWSNRSWAIFFARSILGFIFFMASRGQPTFLNFDQPYPSEVFTVVIWGSDRGNCSEPPESACRGKRLCVTGTIGAYRGGPQIVAKSPAAVQFQR